MNTGDNGILLVILMLLAGIWIYFMPALIASKRKHPNSGAIFALNLLLGWSLLGWVAALVWSVSQINVKDDPVVINHESTNHIEDLEKLYKLKEKGILTDEEFSRAKEKLLS